MANRKQWYFAPNNNGVVDGFNDSGIEMFSSHSLASMVREVIQNSLDQQVDEHKPVVVDFHRFQVTKNEIPGSEQLKVILQKCLATADGDKTVEKFFKQALRLINKRQITVLRISDHNTTGLTGAESGKRGTPWHQLVKSRGASNKNMNAGGSFGIGKSATLACSYFHTIFYASKAQAENGNGIVDSYIGVSRLLSFENEQPGLLKNKIYTTVGTGFYSNSKKMNAILEPLSLDKEYQRQDDGLDIYILALEDDANFEQTILHSVLENFFITLEQKRLVVNIDEETINQDNLAQYIAQMDDKKYADIKNYYDLLIHYKDDPDTYRVIPLKADEYGKEFGIEDGECTLFLSQGEDLNRRILMTRKTGMTLFQQSGFANGISFTGILQITGDKMNEIFKAMEVPAHDKWEPGRCKVGKTRYEKAYKELRQYLRKKVQECFGKADGDIEYVSDLDEFFSAGVGDGQTEISLKERQQRKPKEKMKRRKIKKRKYSTETKPTDNFDGGIVKEDNPDKPASESKPPKTPRPKKISAFKFRAVKKRLIAKDLLNGLYTLNFTVPGNKERARLEFVGVAERGTYTIPVYDVTMSGNDTELTLDKASVTFGPVEKGQEICLEFSVGFGGPMMMEVNYYEAN